MRFWSVLWYLALWVDQNLIRSMYPDVNVFLQVFANPGEHDLKRMLLNMITTSLYLGLPVLWSRDDRRGSECISGARLPRLPRRWHAAGRTPDAWEAGWARRRFGDRSPR